MPYDKNTSADFLSNQLARLFAKELQRRISALGISIGQFPILLALWEQDGLTQKHLVTHLDIEQATVANTLSRMERDALILRKKDPEDGRSQKIWLTARAHALMDDAVAAANQVNDTALASLSSAERDLFIALISKVISGMKP